MTDTQLILSASLGMLECWSWSWSCRQPTFHSVLSVVLVLPFILSCISINYLSIANASALDLLSLSLSSSLFSFRTFHYHYHYHYHYHLPSVVYHLSPYSDSLLFISAITHTPLSLSLSSPSRSYIILYILPRQPFELADNCGLVTWTWTYHSPSPSNPPWQIIS
jgi:hypothetical protein